MPATTIEPRLPRGMRDIVPDMMIRREYVTGVIRRAFEQFGFEPLQTPAVELEETLTSKYGPDADRLMYTVGHTGGKESLGLRYDLTVPLCRVVAQYPDLNKPFRRYQIAPVWRAERPQKGRYREFYQCDVDTVGSASMLADAEILNVTYTILARLGFKQFVMTINDRKLLKGMGRYAGVPDEQLGELYRSIDKLDRIGLGGVEKELRKRDIGEEPIRRLLGLLQIEGSSRSILAELERVLAGFPQATEGVAELAEIVTYLEALGIPERFYQVTPAMVRGLEYYTGPVYETLVEEPKIGSLTGGGRYDNLVGLFTGRDLPATGTTIGIERITDVMHELDMFPPGVGRTVAQVLVTQFSPDLLPESLRLARRLREAGLNVEVYLENDPLGNQIRYALKKEIPYLAIVGPDEAAAEQVALRDLGRKKQVTVDRGEAAAQIQAWRRQGEEADV
jgi:histidyl-tRNA synthetase